jgi:EAL and modified HD-GYP domain-containing signal transduction protein
LNNSALNVRLAKDIDSQDPAGKRTEAQFSIVGSASSAATHRHFALQPIFNLSRTAIGYEALFRAGWESQFSGDSNTATRIMIDNWLLYGYEDLTGSRSTFLNCTREALVSGLLSLLPQWSVFEILESVEPDEEVLQACLRLKALGYRFSLDDFDSPDRMAGFLGLADFIKIDFRLTNSKARANLMRRIKGTGAMLIAEKIETEEEYRSAVWEGFQLFQGYYFLEHASFAMTRDALDEKNGLRLLKQLQRPGFAIAKLADLIDQEPGIGCRLLRRANWRVGPGRPVNSYRDALEVVGKSEFRQIVALAMFTDLRNWNALPPELRRFDHTSAVPDSSEPEPEVASRELPSSGAEGRERSRGKILKMPRKTSPSRPKV